MIRSLVMDSYDWFVTLVDERRSTMTREEVLAVADGSIFTGRQALSRKLIDELGGEEVAKAWLVGKGVSADLAIVEWKRRQSGTDWLLGAGIGQALAGWLGLPAGGGALMRELGADRIFLDGLVSVWQPDMRRYAGK
jgi:protease-4